MSPDRPPASPSARPPRLLLPSMLLAVGLALLAMMVATEGEPGLLPLLLVVGGGAWLAVAWRRGRRR